MRKQTSTNYQNEQQLIHECPFNYTFSKIGGRWKAAILWKIKTGATRFGELQRELPLITQKMLSQELRELEQSEFLSRTVAQEKPLRVEYALTHLGESVLPLLETLMRWGETHKPQPPVTRHTHAA